MTPILLKVAKPIWRCMPQSVRTQPWMVRLKTAAIGQVPPAPAYIALEPPATLPQQHEAAAPPAPVPQAAVPPADEGVRIVSNLGELDEMLQMLDRAAAISDDELRRGFAKFHMKFPLSLPDDPASAEYHAAQMKLYEWLHGKPYSEENEVSPFDVKAAAARPFPFYTESAQTVGNHIIGIGHLIRTMDLKPKSSVLEFGPGWGNTTIWLARMGYDVTAVDIEKNFVDLITERARQKQLRLNAMRGDFFTIRTFDRKFDAVLFFECFHHCSDHRALIAEFDRVVAPGGKVVFAAEPITDGFPIPWGLRLDGESLWAIRKNGWMELGFQETYFRKVLAEFGWNVTNSVCQESPWGTVFTATRASEAGGK